MTALDISQLTGRVLAINEQHRQIAHRLAALLTRVEQLVLDDGALREDLDRLYLTHGGK